MASASSKSLTTQSESKRLGNSLNMDPVSVFPREKYVLVREPISDDPSPSKEETKVVPEEASSKTGALFSFRSVLGPRKGPKLSNYRTMIGTNATTITGTAATSITDVVSVCPGNTTEHSSFQSLFDECKVHGGRLIFTIITRTLQTGGTNNPTFGVVCYDPVNNSAAASPLVALTHSQHLLCRPPQMLNDASDAGRVAPVSQTSDGYFQFNFKCPKGPQLLVGSTTVFTGGWMDTVQTTGLYGFLKFIIEAPGTAGVYQIRYVLMLDIEYRSRS